MAISLQRLPSSVPKMAVLLRFVCALKPRHVVLPNVSCLTRCPTPMTTEFFLIKERGLALTYRKEERKNTAEPSPHALSFSVDETKVFSLFRDRPGRSLPFLRATWPENQATLLLALWEVFCKVAKDQFMGIRDKLPFDVVRFLN